METFFSSFVSISINLTPIGEFLILLNRLRFLVIGSSGCVSVSGSGSGFGSGISLLIFAKSNSLFLLQ